MRIITLAALSMLFTVSSGGCEPADRAPDAAASETVRYRVGINMLDGIVVTVDGVPLDPGSTGIDVEYSDYAAALASPLFHVETSIGGSVVDAIDIGIGACEERCNEIEWEGCLGQPVEDEQVLAHYDENGVFLGGALSPRSWRGYDCMRCTFLDGFNFVVCS